LEKELAKPDLWQDKEKAINFSRELTQLQETITEIEAFKNKLKEIKENEIEEFEEKLRLKEIAVFLAGKYDKENAILSIFAGAGGQDAQDWATMLLRMYERFCSFKGFKTKILEQSFGEGVGPEGRIGTKSVTLEVQGKFAYGFLKEENGVHRLVRISPFSPKSLRHTSFALVEVVPDVSKDIEKEIQIRPEDLKVETFRASGPGGQYVNKRETAVRITHLPTGLRVACQSERLQGENREKAMKILLAKLLQLKEQEKEKEIKRLKGERVSASWGNQIRSYVLHPYKMVKDLRSGLESADVEGVLDGKLDQFIEAQIKIKND
jgi:peptide chain release factor 2